MAFSIVITVLILVAILATLALGLSTEFFTMRMPSGPDTMGLIIPVLAGGLAALLTLLAAWVGIGRGAFGWISANVAMQIFVVTAAIVGLTILSMFAFGTWTGRKGAALALIGCVVLPLGVQGIILALAWIDPAQLRAAAWPRVIGGVLAVGAVAGLGMGFAVWFKTRLDSHRLVREAMKRHRTRQEP